MPMPEFEKAVIRQKVKDFIPQYLKEMNHAVSVEDVAAAMGQEIEDVRIGVRMLVRAKVIVLISEDRFSLPGQACKYRTLDDFWES